MTDFIWWGKFYIKARRPYYDINYTALVGIVA